MGFKTGMVIGFGAGYVLGSRAGRERYEQISRTWQRLSGSPTVHHAAEKTKELAGTGARRSLHAVQQGVEKAGVAVKERLHRGEEVPSDDVIDLLEGQQAGPAGSGGDAGR